LLCGILASGMPASVDLLVADAHAVGSDSTESQYSVWEAAMYLTFVGEDMLAKSASHSECSLGTATPSSSASESSWSGQGGVLRTRSSAMMRLTRHRTAMLIDDDGCWESEDVVAGGGSEQTRAPRRCRVRDRVLRLFRIARAS